MKEITEYGYINRSLFGFDLVSCDTGKVIDVFDEMPDWISINGFYLLEDYGYT